MLRSLISIQGWPVGLVGTLSRVITLPVLVLWILTFGAGRRSFRPRGQGGWLVLMGLISILINLTWFSAVRWTTATNVGMLIRFDVVFVVLIGSLLGLERIGLRQLALIPVMFVGLALLMEVQQFDWGGHIIGDAMTIVTALGFSVNAFIIRHIMVVMEEESVAFYNHAVSMLGFIGLGLIMGDFARIGEVLASQTATVSIVVLGVFVAVSLPLYYVALRRMDVWKLRMFMLATPVLTAAVEWPLWGMKMSPLQWLGGAIILAALAVLIHMEWQLSARKETADVR
jgi:drug/metabolite transporter (DMT)-like permease